MFTDEELQKQGWHRYYGNQGSLSNDVDLYYRYNTAKRKNKYGYLEDVVVSIELGAINRGQKNVRLLGSSYIVFSYLDNGTVKYVRKSISMKDIYPNFSGLPQVLATQYSTGARINKVYLYDRQSNY